MTGAERPILIVLAHPRTASFNRAIADRVASALAGVGTSVIRHDLYAERFDPVLPAAEAWTSGSAADRVPESSADPLLRRHRADLQRARGLVVVHPNWWGKPPAILAGWLDRVLVPGVAYRLDQASGTPRRLLDLDFLLVVNTSDTPPDREQAEFGDPLDAIWRRCVGTYLGPPVVQRLVFGPVSDAPAEQRQAWLADVATTVRRIAGHRPVPG